MEHTVPKLRHIACSGRAAPFNSNNDDDGPLRETVSTVCLEQQWILKLSTAFKDFYTLALWAAQTEDCLILLEIISATSALHTQTR